MVLYDYDVMSGGHVGSMEKEGSGERQRVSVVYTSVWVVVSLFRSRTRVVAHSSLVWLHRFINSVFVQHSKC